MVNIGLIAVMGVIIVSITIAMYYYEEAQNVITHVEAGNPVQVGPVRYVIEYAGVHEGSEEKRPAHTYLGISIRATNLGDEETRMSGGQFQIIYENGTRMQPTYGPFSDDDLLDHYLQPNIESSWTTQFDVPFDETKKYEIGVLPTKIQSSNEIGIVCLLNCDP